jgi:hypothetical protein
MNRWETTAYISPINTSAYSRVMSLSRWGRLFLWAIFMGHCVEKLRKQENRDALAVKEK